MDLLHFRDLLTTETLQILARVGVWTLVGLPVVYFVSRLVRRYTTQKFAAQSGLIASKLIFYTGLAIIVISILNEFGFKLTHLLATAGVVGVAVGFAAQTSMSNIISGFFLIAESPFVVGDLISVGSTTGEVLSVDTLSVKLRTLDNKMVRIPNESIIKSEVTNITYFPVRRYDLQVSVAYKEDLKRVRELLYEVAHANPLCLQEPEPVYIFQEYGSSSVNITFGVWAERSDWLMLRNSISQDVKARFDQEGIEIPFPHLSLYAGQASSAIPVQMVNVDDATAGNGAGDSTSHKVN